MIATGKILPDLRLLMPSVYGDERGYFYEGWRRSQLDEAGITDRFEQFNVSESRRGVLRGLHYQYPQGQGKFVSVLQGRIFDVAVDIRPDSSTFGTWEAFELSSENHHQLYIPDGFAHGFIALSEKAIVGYFCTAEYAPEHDRAIRWDDPQIAVEWPMEPVSLSAKDLAAPLLANIGTEALPSLSGSADNAR